MSSDSARLFVCGNPLEILVGSLHPSTTGRTLESCVELRKYSFDASQLNREIEQIPMKVAEIIRLCLSNVEVDEKVPEK